MITVTQVWEKWQPTDPSMKWPKERFWHSSVIIYNVEEPHLLVVGGREAESSCEDCWLLNINKKMWVEVRHSIKLLWGINYVVSIVYIRSF